MRISEMMDNYTDNEFLIEGENDISTDEVLKGVMGRIKAEKKPLKLKTKIILIAAAVAVLGLITAAARPGGFLVTKMGEEKNWDDGISGNITGEPICPYVIEDDRVYFTVDGLHEDITDYINNGEIYCYYFTDTDSKAVEHKGMMMVKGPIDHIVFGEVYFPGDPSTGSSIYMESGSEEYNGDWHEEFYQKGEEYQKKIVEEYWAEQGITDREWNNRWDRPWEQNQEQEEELQQAEENS